MSTSTLTFDDIDPTLIDQAKDYLKQLLAEEFPSMDLTQSRVFHDNLLVPAAILHAVNREDIDRLIASFSPLVIAEDPSAADPNIVDAVYANYGVERYEGNKATGLIAVIIEDLVTTAVPEETTFAANGLNFVLDQPYIGVTTQDAVVSSSERLITQRSDGSYVFTVPVTAEEVGESYRMKRDTRFTASPAITGTIDLVAAADFEGGTAAETNAELVERIERGIAPKVFSGRAQIAALLQDQLATLKAVSIVGLGDPEMLRDRHNLESRSVGGKADIYVQTDDVPAEIKLTKECTYLGNKEWQFSILRDDAPGFYLVNAVVPEGSTNFQGSLEILNELRGLDMTPEADWTHQIEGGMVEGAYSRYQTAVVKFEDPNTADSVSVGDKDDYDVYVLRMPSIKLLHDLTIDRSRRPPAGDYLIKAAVPAIMSLTLKVLYRYGTQVPDANAIKQAVASKVNSIGFNTGRIDSALITDAAMGALEPGGTAVITPVNMQAFVYPPDSTPLGRIHLYDPDVLLVPNLPERGVSQRTTCFYLALSDIMVESETMPGLAV